MALSTARCAFTFILFALASSVAGAPATSAPTNARDAKAAAVKPRDAKPDAPQAAEPSKPESAKPADAKQALHFQSLKRDKVYLRSGPSADYPIQWVFVRKGLPVEVLASFDIWRKVRDSDGTQGWVNQQMLSDRRSVLVTGATRSLLHDPRPDAEIVAQVEAGVVAAVSKCDAAWCQVRAGEYQGWLSRDALWGLAPDETLP
jgi:SH3-like domain-containing protein